MVTISKEIELAFQATPIILVFITILFGIFYPHIQTLINKKFVSSVNYTDDDFKSEIIKCIFYKCVPLTLIILSTFCLYLPLLKRIITDSSSGIQTLDFAPTSLVFITVLFFIFFSWSFLLIIQLALKWNNVGKNKKTFKVVDA